MLGKLKGLFVEVEEEPKKPEAPVEAAPQAVPVVSGMPVAVTAAPAQVASVAPPMNGTINAEMAEMLASAIEAADLDGFDYLEFKDSLTGMASVPMTEQQKFMAVFATAQTMGLTKGSLINSIDHYLNVLAQKKAEFAGHVEQQIAAEVTARDEAIAANEQQIEQASAQMQELTAKIQELTVKNQELNNEKIQAGQNIQSTQSSFDATFGMVAGKLTEDKTKIETYLPGAEVPAPAPEAS